MPVWCLDVRGATLRRRPPSAAGRPSVEPRMLRPVGTVGKKPRCLRPGSSPCKVTAIPRSLKEHEVQSLVRSCDRTTVVGKRGYAVLCLLARLGLRAGEVAAMTLDDIDWRAGELTVRGKGGTRERFPPG